jgi:transcriptional regulator with XRE-family HTH domain
VNNAKIATDGRAASAHSPGMVMRIADVTPEWVRDRMAALALTQARVAAEIGLTQDKLSKSLTGKRRFLTSELDALARMLCDPDPATLPSEEAIELARRIDALPEAAHRVLEALVATLEKEVLPVAPTPPEGEEHERDGQV